MAQRILRSDEEVLALIKQGKIMEDIRHNYGVGPTRVKKIAKEHGLRIANGGLTEEEEAGERVLQEFYRSSGRKHFNVENGVVLVGSDAHYWPGLVSTAHRALLAFCRNLKPRAVVLNGDGFDGASISRYPRIGWDKRPTVAQELLAVEERMDELEDAAGTKVLYWLLGNHDARFETFLASRAPEFERVPGFQLKDRFPLWIPGWALWLNEDVVVKHRYKNGIHATHNNTLWSGKSMITGHLHSQRVTPLSDYNGTRWGVDCGCLAASYGPQFENYTEDNPVNWRSGFAVLTFWKGQLLQPELVRVLDEDQGLVDFRGTVGKV